MQKSPTDFGNEAINKLNCFPYKFQQKKKGIATLCNWTCSANVNMGVPIKYCLKIPNLNDTKPKPYSKLTVEMEGSSSAQGQMGLFQH